VQASTAACVTRTCAPSTTYCAPDGSEVRKCAPDGMSFEVVQSCNDSAGRGNHCVGATCIDRCALLEAQDRSTLGCRFAGAAESAQPEVVIANPQPDLPAQVTIANAGAGGSPMTKVVPPGGSLAIAWTASFPSGSSLAARALYVTASVPVYAWLNEPSANVALFPEHALSTSYLAGLDAGANQLLSAVATVDGTQLTATVTSAVAAGPGVAATSAGGTLTVTLDRGDVLTLASSGSLDGSRVQATAPIAVTLASPSGALALPGADTLGREVIVPDPALVIARDPATVTTEVEGTLTLADGAEATLAGNERISSTAPILVIDQLGGREVVPPVEQLRTTSFPAWASGASVTVQLIAPQPLTVAGGGASYPLPASGDFASGSFGFTPRLLSAPMPFFAFFRNNTDIAPGAFGLALLP
ncbi:MAG TPA: hypothetical protein VII38_13125, partial [Polyangia bacterium]